MKKEGTGNPRNPDISFDARVRMRELRFEEVPNPEVDFQGNTGRNSVWTSRRTNLPDEVQKGVVYHNSTVRLRIATEVVGTSSDFVNSLDREGVRTNPEFVLSDTAAQEKQDEKEQT